MGLTKKFKEDVSKNPCMILPKVLSAEAGELLPPLAAAARVVVLVRSKLTLDQLVLGRVSGAVLEVGFLFSFGRKQGSSLLEPSKRRLVHLL